MSRPLAFLVAVFAAAAAFGQEPVLPAAEALKDLGFLVGSWAGEGEEPGVGKYTDEYTYTWGPNKTYLKLVYVMKAGGKILWTDEGRIGWDPDLKKLVAYNFGMDGSIGRGTEVSTDKKDTWVMEGSVVGSPHVKFYRSIMTKVDEDHLTISTEMRKNDKVSFEALRMQRYVRASSGNKEEAPKEPAPKPEGGPDGDEKTKQ